MFPAKQSICRLSIIALNIKQFKQEFRNHFYRVCSICVWWGSLPYSRFLPTCHVHKVSNLPFSPPCHMVVSAKRNHKSPVCKQKLEVAGTYPEGSEEITFLEYITKIIKQGIPLRLPLRHLCVWEVFGRQDRLVYDNSGVHAFQEGQPEPSVSFFWEAHSLFNQCRFFIKFSLIYPK